MKRRVAMLLLVLFLAAFSQGCWNYRELDKLRIVAGIAIDRGETKKYRVTVDLLTTFRASKDKPVESVYLDSEGDTLFDAIRGFAKMSSNKLYFPHCQVVVISTEVAQDSIQPIIDFLMRDSEPRYTLQLLVANGCQAKDALQQQVVTMSISSYEIDSIVENNWRYVGTSESVYLYEAYNTLARTGKSLALPAVRLVESDGEKTAQVQGMAVFKSDRLLGFLSGEETKDYLFITNEIDTGLFTVQGPVGNDIAALEILSARSRISHRENGGAVEYHVDIQIVAALNELDTTQDFIQESGEKLLIGIAQKQISDRLIHTIRDVQQRYGVDIFGFGTNLHRTDAAAWQKVHDVWDDVFKTMKVDVTTTITIKNSGALNSPVEVGR